MKKVIVIGGGAAGLMAACSAAQYGANVIILEKMPSPGRKLLITGKGRCNITNSCDLKTFIANIPGNGKFLHSVFHTFFNQDLIDFLTSWGLATKIERGGRIFPVSDKAADVVETFIKALKALHVELLVKHGVKEIVAEQGQVKGIRTQTNVFMEADAVILAAGGASYPNTGSAGDGYRIAEKLGHTVIPIEPSLVPLEVAEEWIAELQGLSLRNVAAALQCGDRNVAGEFGEMLFTHYGLSGPIILSLSKKVSEQKADAALFIEINLKPALSPELLDKRIQRDFEKFARKQIKNALHELLPAKMIPVMINLAHINPDKPVHQITKEERNRLVFQLQHLSFTITGTRPVAEAIVTAGGISTKEINPATMESRQIRGLYFAGEIIDVDGFTGGFNLQAAFSTGYVAGMNAAAESYNREKR
ncbi:pyridine nucleotide disulphide reductase class-i signature [Lucifera butyrica]|uniref:Pyridine nucleotide disulphide reductase class-i signature n=1 Tax=Lucifera butyrica TaxID=1351585 RepID=A0A498RAG7_9FIRM|nr:NAD(P)/FAD-dependent oxidoreductase [Lucifera butyrica]VBB07965.1 pyridine nucleotide disulphide reductase class-i signature [Lucifera butyrica]